jgi:hypothetical protein
LKRTKPTTNWSARSAISSIWTKRTKP